MNPGKYLRVLILSICFMGLFAAHSYAAGDAKPDLNKKGSISVTMRDKENPVAGGSLLLYQVALLQEAEIKEPQGQLFNGMKLRYCEEFAACGIDFYKEDVSKLTEELFSYCKAEKLTGKKLTIGQDGFVKAESLPLGLYLIVQDTPAKGYEPINPFLIMLPYVDGDKMLYDVDASPKVELKKEENPPETTPDNPPDNPPHKDPPGRLPQTGQLWWPVFILAAAGMLFFMIGWVKRNSNK